MPRNRVGDVPRQLRGHAGCASSGSCSHLRPPRARDPYAPSLAYFHQVNGTSGILGRLLYTDIKTYLVELLMKQDQMSMSASIESRVPFLDHVLVEFAARLPDRLKLRGFTTKRILREAVRDFCPTEILTRPKMGFPVPFAPMDARAVATRRRATCCSIGARVSAASSTPRPSSVSSTTIARARSTEATPSGRC